MTDTASPGRKTGPEEVQGPRQMGFRGSRQDDFSSVNDLQGVAGDVRTWAATRIESQSRITGCCALTAILCFRWKGKATVMKLAADEFIRRFLLHVLPVGLQAHPQLWVARELSPGGATRSLLKAARGRHPADDAPSSPKDYRGRYLWLTGQVAT